MFPAKVTEKIKIHILDSVTFPLPLKIVQFGRYCGKIL
jgi:hypothetical protein